MRDVTFPKGFLWGASTSAHQTEGGNTNSDWWRYECEGRVPASGIAADSWNRWRDDLDIAEELGLNVFRISVEWARVEPRPGEFDQAALAHYSEVLEETRRRGLKTMLVLWHFTNPLWLSERAGWADPGTPEAFATYAGVVAGRLGEHVDYWVTLNEADTFVWQGYVKGNWPPAYRNAWHTAYKVYRNLARGHRLARRVIKDELGDTAQVGLTHLLVWPHPADKGGGLSAANIAYWNYIANDFFLRMISRHVDWLGVQYYHGSSARFASIVDDDGVYPCTDMAWRIEPKGIHEVVMRVWKRLRVPIIVTENGLADATDSQRARFIIDHLRWLHKAIDEGADVRGYLYWSLIDNFEWAHGFAPRFGLAEVDYTTFRRTIRPSARVYSKIVADNGIKGGFGEDFAYADGTRSLAPEFGEPSC